MTDLDDTVAMTLQIVVLRGKLKGRFGWVLYTPDVLVQSRRTFPSKEDAARDASEFAEAPVAATH